MFHSQSFLNQISSDSRSRYIAYDCGHYPMHQCPEEMAKEIESFLQQNK